MATTLQFIICLLSIDSFYEGFIFGLRLFIGLVVPTNIIHYINNPRGDKIVLLIDLSYQLLCILIQTGLMGKFNKYQFETE